MNCVYLIELSPRSHPVSTQTDPGRPVSSQFPMMLHLPFYSSYPPRDLEAMISGRIGVPIDRLQVTQTNRNNYSYPSMPVVELTILPPSVSEALKLKVPSLTQPTIAWLLTHEELKDIERFQVESFKEICHAPNVEIEKLVCITNVTNRNCLMKYHNQEMLLSAILPNDQGVELLGEWSYIYKAASNEQIARIISEREKRDSDIAHCQKLLQELPIALTNSLAATEKLIEEVNGDGDSELSEAGALVFEQYRIKKEIVAREAQLKQLDLTKKPKDIFPFDPTSFIAVTRQASVTIPFGFTRFEGKLYNIFRIEETKRQVASTGALMEIETDEE